ncbi:MAG: hypothetical protein JWQ21_3881 [Herminiimonas sp.]|nr:hypothetical protein [Herminiimonas sp.]
MKLFSALHNSGSDLHLPNGSIARTLVYDDPGEKTRHLHNIERLAEDVHRSVHEIAPLYEEVLAQLKRQAAIHDYLPILVSKNVKHFLKRHH